MEELWVVLVERDEVGVADGVEAQPAHRDLLQSGTKDECAAYARELCRTDTYARSDCRVVLGEVMPRATVQLQFTVQPL